MQSLSKLHDMSKRQVDSEPGGTEPLTKKVVFEPLQLGAINNIEELDVKTLQFQNRILGQRLGLKNKIEEEVRARYIFIFKCFFIRLSY